MSKISIFGIWVFSLLDFGAGGRGGGSIIYFGWFLACNGLDVVYNTRECIYREIDHHFLAVEHYFLAFGVPSN